MFNERCIHAGAWKVRIGTLDTAEARAPQLEKLVALMFQVAERHICNNRVTTELGFTLRLAGHLAAEEHRRVTHALELTASSSLCTCTLAGPLSWCRVLSPSELRFVRRSL